MKYYSQEVDDIFYLKTRTETSRTAEERTMFQFRSFKSFLFLILILSLTAGIQTADLTVRVGGEVTLCCKDVKDFQDNCYRTTWLYADSRQSVTLFESGNIHKDAGDKSQRLIVTVNCSLVLKDVRVEDAGIYTCRHFDESGKQVAQSQVHLSVTTKTEATSTTTKTTTTTSASPAPEDDANTATIIIVAVVAVTVTALLITAVVVVRWRRTKDRKRQFGDNIGLSINPAETNTAPDSHQEKVDPEESVSYATINYFNSTGSRAWVHGGNLQHDMVTYSTVRVHSSPAGGSNNPNSLYSVI